MTTAIFKIKKSLQNLSVFLVLLLLIFQSTAPFTSGDSTLGTAELRSFIANITIVILIVESLIIAKLIKTIKVYDVLLTVVPIIFLFIDRSNIYAGYTISVIGTLRIVVYMLQSEDTKIKIYEAYRKYLVFIAAYGVVCYLLAVLSIPPIRTVDFYSQVLDYKYLDYGLSYFVQEGSRIRLAGMFNEAGFFGTIVAFILCCEKFDFRKKGNIILFVAGIFSWSLAFWLIVLLNYALHSYKRPRMMVMLFLVILAYFFVLPYVHTGIESLDRIIERISLSEGGIAGDNRTDKYIALAIANAFGTNKILWGYGSGYTGTITQSVAGIKVELVNHGILGCLIEYGYLLFVTMLWYLKNKNIDVLILIVCFFVSIYQRANIYSLPYMAVLFGGIAYIKKNECFVRDKK